MQISNNHLEGINSSMNITNNSVNEQQFTSVDSNMVEQHNKIESQQDSKEGQWGESKATLEYSVHKETNTVMIKVVDKIDKTVIAEFPPEKILDLVADMCKRNGLFIDEKR